MDKSEIAARYGKKTAEHQLLGIESALSCCESPIEVGFLLAFLGVCMENDNPVIIVPPHNVDSFTLFDIGGRSAINPHIVIDPQLEIIKLGYRVDFAFSFSVDSGLGGSWIVECDGHGWHERTKQQAARDKKRERELQADGFIVYRFTGSEIYKDAVSCAKEIYNVLSAYRKPEALNG